jgi:hypothetical protein
MELSDPFRAAATGRLKLVVGLTSDVLTLATLSDPEVLQSAERRGGQEGDAARES